MEQNIKITIASRTYSLKASSQRKEELIRKAAVEINQTYNAYIEKFPGRGTADIMSFVALNICMNNIELKEELLDAQKEITAFDNEIENYLEKL